MSTYKISVMLEKQFVLFIEEFQKVHGLFTKSEVVSLALQLLREQELEIQYAAALKEWEENGESKDWDIVIGDSLEKQRC